MSVDNFRHDIKSYLKEEKWASSAKQEARNSISPIKNAAVPFVRIVIYVMAIFYISLNMLRVMKGEGQSRDALLKVALGLMFALIALSALTKFFGV